MAKYKDAPSIMQDEKVCFLSGSLEGLEIGRASCRERV